MNAAWHQRHRMPRGASPQERLAWHRAHQRRCGCRPAPASLRDLLRPGKGAASRALRPLLAGGDRRSIAKSNAALAAVLADPRRVAEVAALAGGRDWLVAMRAMDLLEKVAHRQAAWIQPHRGLFVGPLADSDAWEVRLQIVRALPLLRWSPRERRRVVEILRRDAAHPQKFVRAWALDSLATFAERDPALMPAVQRGLRAFERSGSKALATRARHIRERLAGTGGASRAGPRAPSTDRAKGERCARWS